MSRPLMYTRHALAVAQAVGRTAKVIPSQSALLARQSSTGVRYVSQSSTKAATVESSHDIDRLVESEIKDTPRFNRVFKSQPQDVQLQAKLATERDKLASVEIDGTEYQFSPLLLRDMCTCKQCLDPSTRQKLFSTVEIPSDIHASSITRNESSFTFHWASSAADGSGHVTEIDTNTLRNLAYKGINTIVNEPRERVLWNSTMFTRDAKDIDYQAYMEDDLTLHRALQQLHSHGLLFLTNVPGTEGSVSAIAERIGPVKNTFYGYTWDVRSVPQAKNVAYTSQDLGFHMDLLYMHQPPHLQFLHCIRSSSLGGASLFTDSFKAAADLDDHDQAAFDNLVRGVVHFHYDHPGSQQYRQGRQVFERRKIPRFRPRGDSNNSGKVRDPNRGKDLEAVSWAPPFQAPFAIRSTDETQRQDYAQGIRGRTTLLAFLARQVQEWHAAASQFSSLIHRPEGIYERLMKPGECVIFDNRRVLHARKAFEVGDAGKERWLRGAYLDKDPYLSKMRVLQQRFAQQV